MLQILLGFLFLVVGAFLVIKTEWFYQNFGVVEWAEQKLGGTRIFYKLLGIILVFAGFLFVFNLVNPIVYWIFSPLMPKG